jgi:glycosyltransferase involved in cell wall biosynthesis
LILFVSPLVPQPDGHGGAQRAAFLLDALTRHGPVDYVQLKRDPHQKVESFDHVRSRGANASTITIDSVLTTSMRLKGLHWRLYPWIDLLRFGSSEAPRFSRRALASLARQLPSREYKVICAGRLTAAVLLDGLLEAGLIKADVRIVDLDDIMSSVRMRRLRDKGYRMGPNHRLLEIIDEKIIRHAETRIANSWDASSVCSDQDVATLREMAPSGNIIKVPNVIDRAILPVPQGDGSNFLFVGAFSHEPNLKGLERFLDNAWPVLRAERPGVTLTVVGMAPPPALVSRLQSLGIALHANVPSVIPFYEACDAVISPIFLGGGTRIKLLEAMAFGRPIVTTSIGAEGLDLVAGEHAIIVDDMAAFAHEMIRLSQDPSERTRLARNARALQQERYGPAAMDRQIAVMMDGSGGGADPRVV